MRTYIVILSSIPSQEKDQKFGEYINKLNLDWWRYTALNWILATPDNVSTNMIIQGIVESYGPLFSFVLEVDIKDIGGMIPGISPEQIKKENPFSWFSKIKNPSFVPAWEKNNQ